MGLLLQDMPEAAENGEAEGDIRVRQQAAEGAQNAVQTGRFHGGRGDIGQGAHQGLPFLLRGLRQAAQQRPGHDLGVIVRAGREQTVGNYL